MSSCTPNLGTKLVSLIFLFFFCLSWHQLEKFAWWVMEVLLIFWPFQFRYEFEGESGRSRQTGCQAVFFLKHISTPKWSLSLPSPCWKMVWDFGKGSQGSQESQKAKKPYLMLRMQQPHAGSRVYFKSCPRQSPKSIQTELDIKNDGLHAEREH